jgi:hypothetical protein
MMHAMNVFASGLTALGTIIRPASPQMTVNRVYFHLPSNTAVQAVAGDMRRVGTSIALAAKERKSLRQAEFSFVE